MSERPSLYWELELAAIRAEAQRRNPDWRPWMREWCDLTNFGQHLDSASLLERMRPGTLLPVQATEPGGA